MTNQYFGEYLVAKNVLTIDQLTEALVDQVKSQPPVCSIIYENNLLDKAQIFEAFKLQQDHKIDFVGALKKLSLWNDILENKVLTELFKVQSPLGEVLLRKGFTDFKVLTNMLDEYLSNVEVIDKVEDTNPDVEIKKEDNAEESFEAEYQHGILMELQDAFSEKKSTTIKKALHIALDNVTKDRAISQKLVDDVQKIIHNLNDSLMFFGLEKLGELLVGLTKYLSKIADTALDLNDSALSNEIEFIQECFEMAWDLRSSTIEFATEQKFLSVSSNQSVFENSLLKLNN